MAIDYEKLKKEIELKNKSINVDQKVIELRQRLTNLSKEGAILILANKLGLETKAERPQATIKTIDSLRDGDDYVEVAGATVSIYDLKFYEVCPSCAKRVHEQTGIWKCQEHGVVAPAYSYLLNMMIDDGTGVIRITLFAKQVEKLLGMNAQQVLKYKTSNEWEEMKMSLLGRLLAFRGNCKTNQMTMRKEFTCKLVFKEPADVQPRVDSISLLIKHSEKIPVHEDDEEPEEDEQSWPPRK